MTVIKDNVQQILTSRFRNVGIDKDGEYTLRHGSSRIFIRVVERDSEFTAVVLTVPLLFDVKPSAELNAYIAHHSDDYYFGHLTLSNSDGVETVFLVHTLLGNYLDEEELIRPVANMLQTADHLDDELQAKFGGERYHESE